MVGLTSILREAWNTAADSQDKREKIQALSLAKECYSMKVELLTNATVVDDAIRFQSEYSKQERLKSTTSYKDNSETVQGNEGQIKKQDFLNIAVLIFHDTKKGFMGHSTQMEYAY